ncbi:MAG: PD40 domain-containing protein [Chloroflexi bacterium]|nr:PD40 domain-containing protein [Chloroflexota bacterium]
MAFQGADGNIYTIHPDGGQLRPLTQDANLLDEESARVYGWPTWSPDGERVAFIATHREGQRVKHSLINLRLENSQRVETFSSTDSRPFYLYWSPNGSYISFLTQESDDVSLRLARAGSVVARRLERGSPFYFDWAPDSSALLMHVSGERLAVAKVEGQLEALSDQPGLFAAPAWSRDGRHLLYVTEEKDGRSDLVLAPAPGGQGGEPIRLLRFQGAIAFQWAPVGDQVAYIVTNDPDLGTFGPLWLLDVESGQKTQFTTDNPLAFFWSPDGRKIAYLVPELTTTRANPLSQSQVGLRLGLWVVEVESGERKWLAAFVPSRELLDMLPFFDQYAHSVSFWSPDSRQIVFAGRGEVGGVGVWVVDSENGQRHQIASGPLGVWSWR